MTEGEAVSCHSIRQMCEVISALGPCVAMKFVTVSDFVFRNTIGDALM